jgi:SAM-dependent methyltransferase
MTVPSHLGIALSEYDERIRTFIPVYDEMLDAAAAAVPGRARVVIDLGVGTGALAARCLQVAGGARVVGVDRDSSILALARRRLGERADLICGTFASLTEYRADSIVASLALHHVRTRRAKASLYQQCFETLVPAGVFISADCFPASDPSLRATHHRAWRRHLERTYSPRRASALLRSWQKEDVYLPLNDELALLDAAGFQTDVCWREGMFGVIVGRRSEGSRRAATRK